MFYSYKDLFRQGELISIKSSVYIPNVLSEHKHDFFEIAYITEGSGYHILNGHKTPINKNDLLLLTPKSSHNYLPKNGSTLKWVNCMFLPEAVDRSIFNIFEPNRILQAMLSSVPIFYDTRDLSDIELVSNFDNFNLYFAEMEREYKSAKSGYQELLKNYLQIILIKIFRACYLPESNEYNAKTDSIVDLVLNNLGDNFDSDITQLSQKAFYSPRYFQTLFKKQTGITLSKFIQNKRMETACELLASTDLTVVGIMNKIGMNDTKSFYRLFKMKTGTTPADYRATHR